MLTPLKILCYHWFVNAFDNFFLHKKVILDICSGMAFFYRGFFNQPFL